MQAVQQAFPASEEEAEGPLSDEERADEWRGDGREIEEEESDELRGGERRIEEEEMMQQYLRKKGEEVASGSESDSSCLDWKDRCNTPRHKALMQWHHQNVGQPRV